MRFPDPFALFGVVYTQWVRTNHRPITVWGPIQVGLRGSRGMARPRCAHKGPTAGVTNSIQNREVVTRNHDVEASSGR